MQEPIFVFTYLQVYAYTINVLNQQFKSLLNYQYSKTPLKSKVPAMPKSAVVGKETTLGYV
jgi:hypothetical protein